MQAVRPTLSISSRSATWLLVVLFLFSSCGIVVKKYPRNQPYVFKTTIKVDGKFNREEREALTSRLKGQLDDSLKSRTVSKLIYSSLRNPPVFDKTYADNSKLYMKALLNSMGYWKDSIQVDTLLQKIGKDQVRVTTNFWVRPGTQVVLDSVSYTFKNPALQTLVDNNKGTSKLNKGTPFSKSIVSEELDRLVELFRNNGYLRFTREELVGVWDTLDVDLLRPIADPLEQLRIWQQLQLESKEPKANLDIRLRNGYDSTRLINYKVGNIIVYPDFSPDTAGLTPQKIVRSGLELRQYRPLFHPGIFADKIAFQKGQPYDQRNYFKTIAQLNAMGAWRLVNIEPTFQKGSDTANLYIRLTPARKYATSTNLEASSNQSLLSGNLFGVALNIGLQARNLARRSIQSSTNFRFGVETGRDTVTDINFIQTRQLAFTQSIYFPRMIPRAAWLPQEIRSNIKSVLSVNIANTERRELFNLSSYSAAWGYDFRYKNTLFNIRIPNIEYNAIARRARLLQLIDSNALLKNIFVDGLIISSSAGFQITKEGKKHISSVRFNLEESGLLSGLIRSPFMDSNLFRFVKTDIDLSTKRIFRKTSLAMRFFAGIGYEFNSTKNPVNQYNLPLYRQYFAGGPNSMRAFGLRKLGPGSSIQEYGNKGLPERYGDMQLEANVEFRFPWFRISGMRVNGAVFTDIGNIWYVKKAPGRMPEEIFNLKRLGKDLAVGVGTGLRLDFTYFVIRLDYSIKAKDPSPSPANSAYQNKWFGYPKWSDMDQFQLGINYPFIL
jgi:outer membrane protein insertion porin family